MTLMTEIAPVDLDAVLAATEQTLRSDYSDRVGREAALWHAVCGALLGPRVPAQRLACWFGVSEAAQSRGWPQLSDLASEGRLTPGAIGAAYERRLGVHAATDRRDAGVYFTPQELAEFVVDETLAPLLDRAATVEDVLELTVCDPAAGAGAFASCALERLAERATELSRGALSTMEAKARVVERCLFLVDANPLTIAVLRSLVCMHVDGGHLDLERVEANIRVGDALLARIDVEAIDSPTGAVAWMSDFPVAFASGGFSAIVGNPPWGSVRSSAREWFGQRDAKYLDRQGADFTRSLRSANGEHLAEWQDYAARQKEYAALLKKSAGFEAQGSGDADLYRYFVERSNQLLRPGGRMGLIIPSAFQRADGASPLRQLLFEGGTAELMLDFRNSRRIFDIHPMFRFMVIIWQQGTSKGAQRTAFGLESVEAARASLANAVNLDTKFLRRVSGDRLSVPELRSNAEKHLFESLHSTHPPLGVRDKSTWNVYFSRELDMTNDSSWFIDVSDARSTGGQEQADGTWLHQTHGRLLPLYEGRMVHQFDASAKRYVEGQGRAAKWLPLGPSEKRLAPHFLIPEKVVLDRGLSLKARAGFCDVTGHANERTVLAALIPALAACGNKVPTCRFDCDDDDLPWLWLATANSFVVDWMIRRRVSTTLNYFVWEQIPFPRLDPGSGLGRELVGLARQLDNPTHRPWAMNALGARASVRAQIDAAVCDAFALSIEDFALVLSDFPLLDRGVRGIGNGTVTRDLALLTLAKRRGVTGLLLSRIGIDPLGGSDVVSERVSHAHAEGAIAYVPSELDMDLRRRS